MLKIGCTGFFSFALIHLPFRFPPLRAVVELCFFLLNCVCVRYAHAIIRFLTCGTAVLCLRCTPLRYTQVLLSDTLHAKRAQGEYEERTSRRTPECHFFFLHVSVVNFCSLLTFLHTKIFRFQVDLP